MEISMQNVCKSFGKRRVIRDISLTVPSGGIICLLGPSGSGKTTVIRLLIGAITADSGRITFDGITVPNLALLGGTDYIPAIAVYKDRVPPAMLAALEQSGAVIEHIEQQDAQSYLAGHKQVDAVLDVTPSGLDITMYESSSKSGAALKAIQAAAAALNPSAQTRTSFVIGGGDQTLFESMGYVFFGVISFFLIFIVSGMALVRERGSGTLERMLMTPVPRWGVVLGYTAGYGLFAALQAVVLVLFGIYALGLHCRGNVVWVILVMLLLAVAAVAFGEAISIFAVTEFQVVQMIPIAIIPQIFFSGIIPLDTIPYNLGKLCAVMPIYYGCAAIKLVMVAGGGFAEIWRYLLALAAYILALSAINTAALKKYRRL